MKEDREIRKQVSGPEAAPYIGFARKMLGDMKNHMKLGGLMQLKWSKKLVDGTIVAVESIFGLDKVSIFVPVSAGKKGRKVMKKVSIQNTIVVGSTFVAGPVFDVRRAFSWTGAGTIKNLGTLGDGSSQSEAWGISGDGDVIVGYATATDFSSPRAFRHTDGAGMVAIAAVDSYAYAASGDGSVVVGDMYPSGTALAYRWTEATGAEAIMSNESFARGVSEDGNVVVGYMQVSGDTRAYRWTATTGATDILGVTSTASAVSADGSTVVGEAGGIPFKWTVTGGVEYLSLMGGTSGTAKGVSEDGSTVVGAVTIDFETKAVLWDAGGVMEIATLGGTSNGAQAISYNGSVVVGYVNDPANGNQSGFVVEDKGAVTLIEPLGATISGFVSGTAYAVAVPTQTFVKETDE